MYTVINDDEVASGQPVTSAVLTKVAENFEDHESRLQSIEGGAGTTYPPLVFSVNGPYWITGLRDGVGLEPVTFPITITGGRLLIQTAGTAGTTEIDIKMKRGVASWVSIFTTKPAVAFGSGSYFLSTNAVLDSTKVDLQAGDLLRCDITSVQTNGNGFLVRLDYVKN